MNVIESSRDTQHVDEAAQIWAAATAAREGQDSVPDLTVSRPVIQQVLDRSARAILLIAHADDETATGFAAIEPLEDTSEAVAQVSYLGVLPEMWGQGVASRLLEDVQLRLKMARYARAELSVYVENSRATALYERLGWRPRGEPTPHPRTGKPEQRYELHL